LGEIRFFSRRALAVAVVDRCCEDFLMTFKSALNEQRCASLDDCIRALVEMAFVSAHLPPDRHRCVLDLAPRLGVADRTEGVRRAAAEMIESTRRKHAGEVSPEIDLATAAVMLETTLEARSHRAALAGAAQAENDRPARETTRLLSRYLAVKPPASAP
jgi:Tetracyclin repressor-like, C-terminal domain